MRLLGVVPARAGSRRLPNKNIEDLGGKPLIAWSIDVGRRTCAAGVIVSTDSEIIGRIAMDCGAILHRRGEDLSGDDVTTEAVVRAVATDWKNYEAVVVLQPTSPFRTEEDIARSVEIMEKNNADVVISVIPFQERDALFRIGWADRMRPAHTSHDMVYVPNGAIYLVRSSALADDWYGNATYAYRMPLERSLDIDWHADLDAARALLQAREFTGHGR